MRQVPGRVVGDVRWDPGLGDGRRWANAAGAEDSLL